MYIYSLCDGSSVGVQRLPPSLLYICDIYNSSSEGEALKYSKVFLVYEKFTYYT